jgi:acyl carrier protein
MDEFIQKFKVAYGRSMLEGLEISEKTLLADLPFWDSLAVVLVVLFLDSEYNKDTDAREIARCKTIGDLYKTANESDVELRR